MRIVLLIVFGCLSLFANSQESGSKNKKAIKYFNQAQTLLRQQKFAEAETALLKSIQKDSEFSEAMLLLSDVYKYQNMNDKAIETYNKLLKTDSINFPEAYFFRAELLIDKMKYERAISSLKKYLLFELNNPERVLLAKFEMERANFASEAIKKPLKTKLIKLKTPINSQNNEYINFVSDDLNTIFFTRKFTEENSNSFSRESFFNSKKMDGYWSFPEPIQIPGLKANSGGMTMTFDGHQMFFTVCNWPETNNSCDIYSSYLENGNWKQAFEINDINSKSWDSQASVSADGNTIYFASKRKGGKGGSDIWKTIKLENGKWSPAINLGDSINTSANEMAPFIHPDGTTLYFSSDGHIGMGGYDLYVSKKDESGIWGKGNNLMYPINTPSDEINIFIGLDSQSAWISSNRDSINKSFNIYSLDLPLQFRPEKIISFRGKVLDKESKKPLKADIEIVNLDNGSTVSRSFTDNLNGEFLSVLIAGNKYAVNISSKGYFFYSSNIDLSNEEFYRQTEDEFLLMKIKQGLEFALNNIYFETNKWELKSESFFELNKLLKILKKNPDLKIEIQGHTDNTGDKVYNLELSEKRAKSVADYLIEKGINSNRLKTIGYGDSRPVAENSSEKGRALNRRTVVRVL